MNPCAKRSAAPGARFGATSSSYTPRLHLIGQEQRDDLRVADGFGDGADGEAGLLGRGAGRAALAEADLDVDAGVVQVESVRVALAPVADDGDLAGEQVEVAFAVDRCH